MLFLCEVRDPLDNKDQISNRKWNSEDAEYNKHVRGNDGKLDERIPYLHHDGRVVVSHDIVVPNNLEWSTSLDACAIFNGWMIGDLIVTKKHTLKVEELCSFEKSMHHSINNWGYNFNLLVNDWQLPVVYSLGDIHF